jgi:hypothetical protein
MRIQTVGAVVGAAMFAVGLAGSAHAAEPRKLKLALEGKNGSLELTLPMDGEHSAVKDAFSKMKLDADSDGPGASRLRTAWAEIKRSGGTETISMNDADNRATLTNEHGTAVVRIASVSDPQSKVTLRIPADAMDALLAGNTDKLDYDAALHAMWKRGRGEVIRVDANDASIRLRLE